MPPREQVRKGCVLDLAWRPWGLGTSGDSSNGAFIKLDRESVRGGGWTLKNQDNLTLVKPEGKESVRGRS